MQNIEITSLDFHPGRIKKDDKAFVTSRLTGKFFGSPMNLRLFGLRGQKIVPLEIIP